MHIFDRFHIRQLLQAHFLAVLPDWQERPELNSKQHGSQVTHKRTQNGVLSNSDARRRVAGGGMEPP